MAQKEKLEALSKAVATGNAAAGKLAQEALASQLTAEQILRESLVSAMKVVGKGMQEEEYAFPEIQGSIKALQSTLDVLRAELKATTPSSTIPKWEGTGELYELGSHLVTFLDKGTGLQGYDLILFFDECIRGLLAQVEIPCKKQIDSTHK
jgi:methanogenic corrinoid protein MtbC1